MHSTETSNRCYNIKYTRVFYMPMCCPNHWEQKGNTAKAQVTQDHRKEMHFWRIRLYL